MGDTPATVRRDGLRLQIRALRSEPATMSDARPSDAEILAVVGRGPCDSVLARAAADGDWRSVLAAGTDKVLSRTGTRRCPAPVAAAAGRAKLRYLGRRRQTLESEAWTPQNLVIPPHVLAQRAIRGPGGEWAAAVLWDYPERATRSVYATAAVAARFERRAAAGTARRTHCPPAVFAYLAASAAEATSRDALGDPDGPKWLGVVPVW